MRSSTPTRRSAIGGATIGWVNAAMRACVRMAEPDFAETVPMPVLIVLAGADSVVSNFAAEAFCAAGQDRGASAHSRARATKS